jgi:hypothetical protein
MRPVASVVVGPVRQWPSCSPAVNARRACVPGSVAPWIYKSKGGGTRRIFTSTLNVRRPRPFRFRPRAAPAPSPSHSTRFALHAASPIRMAPPQPITIIDPLPWPHSTATRLALSKLVTAASLQRMRMGVSRRGSSRRRGTGSPTRHSATSSPSSAFMSAASQRR